MHLQAASLIQIKSDILCAAFPRDRPGATWQAARLGPADRRRAQAWGAAGPRGRGPGPLRARRTPAPRRVAVATAWPAAGPSGLGGPVDRPAGSVGADRARRARRARAGRGRARKRSPDGRRGVRADRHPDGAVASSRVREVHPLTLGPAVPGPGGRIARAVPRSPGSRTRSMIVPWPGRCLAAAKPSHSRSAEMSSGETVTPAASTISVPTPSEARRISVMR